MKKGKAVYIGNSIKDKLTVNNLNETGKPLTTAHHGFDIDSNRIGKIIHVHQDGKSATFQPHGLDHILVEVSPENVRMIPDDFLDKI